MLSPLQRRSALAAAALILLAGVAAGAWNRARTRDTILADLIADAKRCAVAFEPAELRSLAGAKTDVTTPAYAAVKARLMRLHDVHPQVHYVYLFRFLPATGQVIFLADSTPPGADDESLPGEEYENIQLPAKAPGLRAIIRDNQPATEGPEADKYGEWVTGYALVGDPPPAGTPKDIVGLDLDAANWRRDLGTAAFTAAGLVWVLLGVPLAALVVTRRGHAHREALRNLSEAMEQSPSAVLIVDLDSRIEYANAGLCRQIGHARRELLGRPWRDFQVPETPTALIAEMVATVRAGQTWTGEWFNRRKSGEVYPVRGVITPVKDGTGRVASFVAIFDDMTAAKHHEAELEQARDRAEAGDQAKGRFLATMSHELHTPLNGIVGFTSLLSDTPLTPEQRECVETIRLSADTLLRLTGDVLDYSRIEAGRVALEPVSCDPRDLVEETLDLLATQAADKSLELLHHTAPTVPAQVSLDAGRVRQALVNLVGNAIKFTATGEVEVTLTAHDQGNARCLLEFSVRDTGPGIAPEEQDRLFQPFSQLDSGIRRRHGGAGLGLAISRHLARLLGGDITVEQAPRAGATFRLVVTASVELPPPPRSSPLVGRHVALVCAHAGLRAELAGALAALGAETVPGELDAVPAARADAVIVDCNAAVLARVRDGGPPAADWPATRAIGLIHSAHTAADRSALRAFFPRLLGKPLHHSLLAGLFDTVSRPPLTSFAQPRLGLRLLLVDDNPVNLRLLQSLATALGCEAASADSGEAALATLAGGGGNFDALLLDIHMPGMDGLEVVRRLRAGEAGAAAWGMWVIMVTADQRPEMRERALTLGASDYLLKPVTIEGCLAALRRVPRKDAPVR